MHRYLTDKSRSVFDALYINSKSNQVYSSIVFPVAGQFSFYSQPKSHGAASIVEFMERAMAYSRSGQFLYFLRPNAPGLAPAPVQLLYPVSRLDSVPSLQHLCRFVIASRVRRDHIDFLPTPTSLKEYLKQTQFYAMT